MVICASVCKPDTPDWWVLEPYSFWLRHTWAAGNIGRGHTSTWHFENPNRVRRPSIHKYSKLPVSIEILEPVFFESFCTSYFFITSTIRTSDQFGFFESRYALIALRETSGRLTTVFPADQVV